MAGRSAHRLRRDVTARGGVRFGQAYAQWADRWSADSDRSLLHTPLTRLDAFVAHSRTLMDERLADVAAILDTADAATIEHDCARVDAQLAWTDALWSHFRDRIDQRRDPELGVTLAAADEICWATFAPGAERLASRSGVPRGAAPLPCVEPVFSAFAQTVDDRTLAFTAYRGMDEATWRACLETLPIPVVVLPEAVRDRPWMLAVLAHEVGHHVQRGEADGRLSEAWAGAVERAAEATTPGSGRTWRPRHQELFADVWSALTAGEAAGWALAELTRPFPGEAWTRAPNPRYPARETRLAVIAAVLDVHDVPGATELAGWRPGPPPAGIDPAIAREHAEAGALVARLLAEDLDGLGTIGSIAQLPPPRADRAARIAHARLVSGDEPVRDRSGPAGARSMLLGATMAWAATQAIEDAAEQAERAETIRRGLGPALVACALGSTRSSDHEARAAIDRTAAIIQGLDPSAARGGDRIDEPRPVADGAGPEATP